MSPTATNRAYDALKHDIMHAVLQPREQFLEVDLAERLGMSRTPVREACIRLQSEGLVEVIPRRGVRIVAISAKDMAEVYDLLGVLESRAAELAATNASESEIDGLDRVVERMEAALAEDDLDGWAAADQDFHRGLVMACGNQRLARAVIQHADLVHRARLITLRLRPQPTKSVTDHRDLVAAIRTRDAGLAHDLHLTHRRDTSRRLVELLESLALGSL